MTPKTLSFPLLPLLALLPFVAPARSGDPEEGSPGSPRALESRLLPDEFWRRPGRAFRFGDPDKPAVLFFHGLNRDIRTWTAPGDDDEILRYVFREEAGDVDIGRRSYPGVGVFKAGLHPRREPVNERNWFDYLAAQGCTVAAFSQKLPTFADAMTTVEEIWPKFLAESAKLNPAAPPPVALIGHSRGGLVIRQLIRRHPESMDRVRWVVTLHSPHLGSELARAPEELEREIREAVLALAAPDLGLPAEIPLPDFREELARAVLDQMRPLLRFVLERAAGLGKEDRELAPDSALLRALAQGERKLENARYLTFGGTEPNYGRLYVWWFTAGSAVPHFSTEHGMYYKWKAEPREIGAVSPMLAKARDFVPEVVPGKGDGLVSDARSRLSWSEHTTDDLNHAEPLWNRTIQGAVARALVGPRFRTEVPFLLAGPEGAGGPDEPGARGEAASSGGSPKSRQGGGLDSIPPVDPGSVKASEGDTATAIRGRPAHETISKEVTALLEDVSKRLRALDERVTALDGGGPAPGEAAPGGTARGSAPDQKEQMRVKPARAGSERRANASLKGRVGRLVVQFPEGSGCKDDVTLFPDGEPKKHIHWASGGLEMELLPGRYAIEVHGKRMGGIEIATGQDTQVILGVIRIRVGAKTQWNLYEPGATNHLTWGNGEKNLGVVPGTYEIEITKRRETVAVGPGEIADF